MKVNFHTHTTWCDGKATARRMAEAAVEKGFDALGFSSHSMLPETDTDWVLTPEKIVPYATEIRALAREFEGRLRILCGVEADYIPGGASPDRSAYACIRPDYVIGSVHFVLAPDGARVPVDHTPDILANGIRDHFGGSPEAYVRGYFRAVRESLAFDFDFIGHPDLVRKFNDKTPWFSEDAPWYREELVATADAIAASGKPVEVNTGAISRGWMDDAYPSASFRALLHERGVKFLLSSDAHAPDALDCAFDRFATAEEYLLAPSRLSPTAPSR